MNIVAFDHIVLVVADVRRTRAFYETVLGMEAREERAGKWSLYFGDSKISLQDAASVPDIARNTKPGTGNFCLICDDEISAVLKRLARNDVPVVAGPDQRSGALGTLLSVYFHDPDGNLVEVSNRL